MHYLVRLPQQNDTVFQPPPYDPYWIGEIHMQSKCLYILDLFLEQAYNVFQPHPYDQNCTV